MIRPRKPTSTTQHNDNAEEKNNNLPFIEVVKLFIGID
jgi:hypothetical protein